MRRRHSIALLSLAGLLAADAARAAPPVSRADLERADVERAGWTRQCWWINNPWAMRQQCRTVWVGPRRGAGSAWDYSSAGWGSDYRWGHGGGRRRGRERLDH